MDKILSILSRTERKKILKPRAEDLFIGRAKMSAYTWEAWVRMSILVPPSKIDGMGCEEISQLICFSLGKTKTALRKLVNLGYVKKTGSSFCLIIVAALPSKHYIRQIR